VRRKEEGREERREEGLNSQITKGGKEGGKGYLRLVEN
jgi:hypothetical protein